MSDIVEAVARAMAQKDAEDEGLKFPTSPTAYRTYMGLARAAIDAYEVEQRKLQTHRATLQSAYNDAYIRGGFLDRVGKP